MAIVTGREERLTFKGNLKQTRYGWLRLTPAYSVHLVQGLLAQRPAPLGRVLDPFCGTGTTALVCAERGVHAQTTDINPFLIWLTNAKTAAYEEAEIDRLAEAAADVLAAIGANGETPEWLPALHQIEKWWDEPTLHALGRAMAAIRALDAGVPDRVADLLRVAFCRTLIARASVSFGHQSMSFKQRRAQEALLSDGDLAGLVAESWAGSVRMVAASAASPVRDAPEVLLCDARELESALAPGSIGCVITSPPYANRMSYIRELRPYMYWLGYLSDGRAAGELDWQAIGGTWGCATSNVGKWSPAAPRAIPHPGFERILDGIAARSELLSRYVHKYFHDMVDHAEQLQAVLAPGATAHYIVGNSKFYDVLVPVEELFARIFEASGLVDARIEVIRKRSSKRELFEYVVSARKP